MPKEQADFQDLLATVTKKNGLVFGAPDDVVGLDTGNLAINHITGVGGLPQGRITELYGLPSSGKTTTALQTAARLQRKIISGGAGEYILYLDFEHTLDGDYATDLGLDLSHPSFIIAQPAWLEQGAMSAFELINSGKVRLSIWDSVAAMTPQGEPADFDQRTNAMNRARLMSGLLQRLNSLLWDKQCAGVFINHLMESVEMGGRPGMPPKATTPGGRGLKYYASLRIEYKQIKEIKGKAFDPLSGDILEQHIATHVQAKCTKNKVAKPFGQVMVRSRYGAGFDNTWSAVQVLVAHGAVKKNSTGYYTFDGVLTHPAMPTSARGLAQLHGEPAVLEFADANPDWRAVAIAEAERLIESAGAPAIEPVDDDDLVVAL